MSSCAISDLEVQQDDGTMRGVEIAPEGCHPVSTDECSSGYMAPSENVTFPENSIVKQCCKCKEGEKCNLCADPDACTEEEVEKYISTNETCTVNHLPKRRRVKRRRRRVRKPQIHL